jgi:small-conductance mechanosensitive channel
MNIPVIGWIYLMYLAFNRRHTDRRNFARAYLFYKLVFLTVALIIILLLGVAALNLLDQLLAYMQML